MFTHIAARLHTDVFDVGCFLLFLQPEAQESFSLVIDSVSQMLVIVLKADFCATNMKNDVFRQAS